MSFILLSTLYFFKNRFLPQIRIIDRKQEVPHDGAMCDLLWSDPEGELFVFWGKGFGHIKSLDGTQRSTAGDSVHEAPATSSEATLLKRQTLSLTLPTHED